jgi:hypothetical protein
MSYGSNHAYRDDGKSYNAGEVILAGGFNFNGTSDPITWKSADSTASTGLPNGITSIVYSATGVYTVTFDDNFYACVGVDYNIELATFADKTVQFNGFTNLGSGTAALTAKFTTASAGSAASIAANGTDGVWFTFRFKRSMSK